MADGIIEDKLVEFAIKAYDTMHYIAEANAKGDDTVEIPPVLTGEIVTASLQSKTKAEIRFPDYVDLDAIFNQIQDMLPAHIVTGSSGDNLIKISGADITLDVLNEAMGHYGNQNANKGVAHETAGALLRAAAKNSGVNGVELTIFDNIEISNNAQSAAFTVKAPDEVKDDVRQVLSVLFEEGRNTFLLPDGYGVGLSYTEMEISHIDTPYYEVKLTAPPGEEVSFTRINQRLDELGHEIAKGVDMFALMQDERSILDTDENYIV